MAAELGSLQRAVLSLAAAEGEAIPLLDLELQARSIAPEAVLVEVAGPLTTATRERLRRLLRAGATASARRVLIDCSDITEADPAGFAVLLLLRAPGDASVETSS